MFEAEQQFFPTPFEVAIQVKNKSHELVKHPQEIVDTSAGKGDLLKTFANRYDWKLKKYAIEIDSELRLILKEDYIVIGSDFFAFDDPMEFDVVVMNPPFKRGAEHALRGWNFVKPDGCIVGLLNAETLRNPCTKERRRLLNLIEEHGGWKSLGSAFSKAERPTDVEVVMFWMKKPEKVLDPNNFKFSGNFTPPDPEVFAKFKENPLVSADAITALVGQYKTCAGLLQVKIQCQSELNFHLSGLSDHKRSDDKVHVKLDYMSELQDLKYRMWWTIFDMTKMCEGLTSDFRKKFDHEIASAVHMEFNRGNILELLAGFFANKNQIFIDACCYVFDRGTAYYEKNKIHPEGWKTNSGWKLNKRIIIPSWGIQVGWTGEGWQLSHGSSARIFYSDLDQVLETLSEGQYKTNRGFLSMLHDHSRNDRIIEAGQWVQLGAYKVRLYKKGTVHIEFTDAYLLEDLNAIVAKERNWIGGEGF